MSVVDSICLKDRDITMATCRGDDTQINAGIQMLSPGGVVYETLKSESVKSLSNRLQLMFGIKGQHDITRGPIIVIS